MVSFKLKDDTTDEQINLINARLGTEARFTTRADILDWLKDINTNPKSVQHHLRPADRDLTLPELREIFGRATEVGLMDVDVSFGRTTPKDARLIAEGLAHEIWLERVSPDVQELLTLAEQSRPFKVSPGAVAALQKLAGLHSPDTQTIDAAAHERLVRFAARAAALPIPDALINLDGDALEQLRANQVSLIREARILSESPRDEQRAAPERNAEQQAELQRTATTVTELRDERKRYGGSGTGEAINVHSTRTYECNGVKFLMDRTLLAGPSSSFYTLEVLQATGDNQVRVSPVVPVAGLRQWGDNLSWPAAEKIAKQVIAAYAIDNKLTHKIERGATNRSPRAS